MDGMKILIVDDDREFSSLLCKKVESWGYETVKAAGGKEALGLLGKKDIAMVILDYQMPDMDGLETLEEIRKIDGKIPVIMFTSFPDKRSIEGTEKLGIAAFIPKKGVFTDADSSLKAAITLAAKKK